MHPDSHAQNSLGRWRHFAGYIHSTLGLSRVQTQRSPCSLWPSRGLRLIVKSLSLRDNVTASLLYLHFILGTYFQVLIWMKRPRKFQPFFAWAKTGVTWQWHSLSCSCSDAVTKDPTTPQVVATLPCEMPLFGANCYSVSLITPLVSGVAGLNASSSSSVDTFNICC